MSRKKLYLFIGVALVVIVGLLVAKKRGFIKGKEKGQEVEVTTVKEATIIETVTGTGKIQPEKEVKIASMVSGEITVLSVKEGQVVKKGDLLLKINPDLYTSSLNRSQSNLSGSKSGLTQADAQFKEAKLSFDRNKTLYEKGIISKADWDKAQSAFDVAKATKQTAYYNVQSAEATVVEAKDNLGRTTIYAPADGTISMLDVELGERVLGTQQMAGTELMRVSDLNSMEVEVDINENDVVKISIGDSAKIEVDAYLKKEFKGIVTSISNAANKNLTADQVTNFKVKVKILKSSYLDLLEGKPSTYSPFRPGMTATVDIETRRKTNVLSIPISAVVIKSDTLPAKKIEEEKMPFGEEKQSEPKEKKVDQRLECVFVKVDDKAKIKIITTGIQDDTNIEVISGLKKEETIITGPYTTVTKDLNSGDAVFVLSEEEKKKKSKE
jgi:HlyD family secretion protein